MREVRIFFASMENHCVWDFFSRIPCLMILVKINSTRKQKGCNVFTVIEQDEDMVITHAQIMVKEAFLQTVSDHYQTW